MRAGTDERLLHQPGQLERYTELTPESGGEPEVFTREVHGELDVVRAVQDDLALGFVHEAVARTLLDGLERFGQVEPTALGQHERLTTGHQVDEGEHVGDDLDDRGAAERAHVEDGVADGFEQVTMLLEDRFVAAHQHGDIAFGCLVHTAGDGAFEHVEPALDGHGAKPHRFVAIVGAHVDPGAALAKAAEDAVGTGDHDVDDPR